ncbi:MAG: GxxExxY protein [Flavobacteriales bacterium]|nr:GxxExxY protein [Flavobacteriales bacterium]
MTLTQKYLDDLTYELIGASIEVHKTMGRGLLESVYQACLVEELKHRKINFSSEFKIPVMYRNKKLAIDFRCDFFVENAIVLELKAINEFSTIHEAQLLNYMQLLKAPKGILINFNCNNIFHEGQKTFVNHYFSNLPKK